MPGNPTPKQKVALVTGITGQDGSYLAEFLVKKGYFVHGLVRRSSMFNTGRIDHIYRDPHLQNVQMKLHFGDLTDISSLVLLLNLIRPDEVYNLGAQSHVRVSFDLPVYTSDSIAMGTLRILEAIRILGLTDTIKFYQASTSEMFGSALDTPKEPLNSACPKLVGLDESSSFQPRSPYGCAKLMAYWSVKTYRESYGLFAANGILFNHESPRRGGTFVTRKITRAVSRIAIAINRNQDFKSLQSSQQHKKVFGASFPPHQQLVQIQAIDVLTKQKDPNTVAHIHISENSKALYTPTNETLLSELQIQPTPAKTKFLDESLVLASTPSGHFGGEEPLCLYLGNLDGSRDWGHARDYVKAMWMMLQAPTPSDYVIATGETRTVRCFVEHAFRYVGIPIVWYGTGMDEIGVDGRHLVEKGFGEYIVSGKNIIESFLPSSETSSVISEIPSVTSVLTTPKTDQSLKSTIDQQPPMTPSLQTSKPFKNSKPHLISHSSAQYRLLQTAQIQPNQFHALVRVDKRYLRPSEVNILLGNATKARQNLGWQPETSFDMLVSEMMEYDLGVLGWKRKSD